MTFRCFPIAFLTAFMLARTDAMAASRNHGGHPHGARAPAVQAAAPDRFKTVIRLTRV